MQMERRVAQLEGGRGHSSLGEVLDALAEAEAGGAVDWAAIAINPKLADALRVMPVGDDQ